MGSRASRPRCHLLRTRPVPPALLVLCLAGTVIAQQPGPPGNVRILREPAAVSNVSVSSITTSAATITWTTAAASSSQVEFGTTSALGSATSVNNTPVTSHTVTLSGLASGTLYHFRVLSRDGDGNLWTSLPQTFTTLVPPDTTAPSVSITSPAPGAVVDGSVTVAASASDNVGVVGVHFRLDGVNLGSEDLTAPYSIVWDSTGASDGAHTLTAVARDAAGNTRTSPGISVTVENAGVTAVTLFPQDTTLNLNTTNYSADQTLYTYTWPANRVANAILIKFDLSSLPQGAVIQDATLNLTLVESDATAEPTYAIAAHKIEDRNPIIASATGYTYDGVTGWTANTCCSNNVPMAQANISPAYTTLAVDKALGVKSWTLTTMVQEWVTSPSTNLGVLLNSDTSKLADRYRYFASMEHTDPAFRPSLRVTYTLSSSDSTPPVISAVVASGITASGAAIAWTTNELSDSQVDYGTTTSYGSSTTLNVSLVTAHTALLSGLSANTQYHYRVRSRDAAGNVSVSGDFTFTTLGLDITQPTVAISSPAAGATVSGTVTVSATASDNVGVTGVQFRLDGANLGAEDTTSPYAVSWNTSTAANGAHTLTAIARDAAGNQRTSTGVSVTVSNATSGGGIAALYPGDVGIENHPDVVFTEMFEQSSISNLTSRYTDVNNSAGMSFTTNIPAASGGSRALQMTTNGSSNEAAGLYRTFPNDSQWYLRYYINYNSSVEYGHTSVWMGGYNPSLSFPNPQAGSKPAGNDRFSTGVEPLSFDNDRWMPYTYWKDMRPAGDGQYWGNVFLPSDTSLRMARNRWYCVETMVKVNTPVTDSNGELAMWIDGQKILHLGKGFPNGTWSGGTFTQNATGSPFSGFQWRSDSALNLNWLWLQNYVTGVPSSVQFDHVVLARSPVGCLASGTPDTTPPTVSITAPASGATVSGSAVTVSATAADAVGVAGVQFKLDGVNLGAEDTTAPYSISWNTTSASNGSHTLTAVARDASGNTRTSAAVGVTVANVLPGGSWPNEPSGLTLFNDQPWDLLTGIGWSYLRRSSSKDASIVLDTDAPLSPLNILRMVFTTDMGRDQEPSVHWKSLPRVKEIYTGYWLKVSPNWSCSGAGCGKVSFLFAETGGQVYTNLYQAEGSSGPPFRIGVNTEWAPYGQHIWYPNVTTTVVQPGSWHRLEFYYRWETTPGSSGDGIIRWWVDGVLNGDHRNVHYPSSSFVEFQFAPTLQNPPPAEQYMYVDHTRLSIK